MAAFKKRAFIALVSLITVSWAVTPTGSVKGANHHSATNIESKCRGHDGASYLSASESHFVFECNVARSRGRSSTSDTLQECVQRCDSESKCRGMGWNTDSKECFMKFEDESSEEEKAQIWVAELDSELGTATNINSAETALPSPGYDASKAGNDDDLGKNNSGKRDIKPIGDASRELDQKRLQRTFQLDEKIAAQNEDQSKEEGGKKDNKDDEVVDQIMELLDLASGPPRDMSKRFKADAKRFKLEDVLYIWKKTYTDEDEDKFSQRRISDHIEWLFRDMNNKTRNGTSVDPHARVQQLLKNWLKAAENSGRGLPVVNSTFNFFVYSFADRAEESSWFPWSSKNTTDVEKRTRQLIDEWVPRCDRRTQMRLARFLWSKDAEEEFPGILVPLDWSLPATIVHDTNTWVIAAPTDVSLLTPETTIIPEIKTYSNLGDTWVVAKPGKPPSRPLSLTIKRPSLGKVVRSSRAEATPSRTP